MHTRTQARLQVVAGPMFAGKSEELLRRVRRARIAGLAVCAVCGEDAPFHQRLAAGDIGDPSIPTRAQVGGIESYQARCRQHFTGAPSPVER